MKILLKGQFFASIAQSFVIEVPAYLASLWFESSQVSTATSIGVFGNQVRQFLLS